MTKLLVATTSFACTLDGRDYVVHAGVTRVSARHPLVKGREALFEPAEPRPDVETATAAPGEKRGGSR